MTPLSQLKSLTRHTKPLKAATGRRQPGCYFLRTLLYIKRVPGCGWLHRRFLHPKYCRHLDPQNLLYMRCSASWETDLKLLSKVKPNLAGPRGGSTQKSQPRHWEMNPVRCAYAASKSRVGKALLQPTELMYNCTSSFDRNWTGSLIWEELSVLSISSEKIHNNVDTQSNAVPVINQGVTFTGFGCSEVWRQGPCSLLSAPLSGKNWLTWCHFTWATLDMS